LWIVHLLRQAVYVSLQPQPQLYVTTPISQ
jgi:hypothetical protein